MIQIGPHTLPSKVILAPMAGVTDLPFRKLCKSFGAGLTASEMLTSNMRLWNSEKNRLRRQHQGENSPRVVQIAGSDAQMLSQAAKVNAEHGAQIIDINMGCPAKKVLKKAAGSALLKDEINVKAILEAVVSSVDIPVTLKIRTGWDTENRNGTVIARIAEDAGISALAVHGRTRACMFKGEVEYDTIAAIKESISIPVFANGDIHSPQKAAQVLAHTKADGVMIGRASQGRPWIFEEIDHFLEHNALLPEKPPETVSAVLKQHLHTLYDFYGEFKGVLIARKHVGWYLKSLTTNDSSDNQFRSTFNALTSSDNQLDALACWFDSHFSKQECCA